MGYAQLKSLTAPRFEANPSAATGNVCRVAHSNLQAPTEGFEIGNPANVPGGSTISRDA